MKRIIVAIDGFSSCGKSTMAKQLAHDVGYIYVDTGAMYRAVSLYCMRSGWMDEKYMDVDSIEKNIRSIQLEFKMNKSGSAEIYLNGENVEQEIRSLKISNGASRVSTLEAVRKELVGQQQKMGENKGIVMDGRDIGTVVFPDAELKIFLTATPEIRAHRRMEELKAKGEQISFEEVLANIKERDERDQNRKESPLKKADDAIVIDNSTLTIEEQQKILRDLFALHAKNSEPTIEIDKKSGFCFGVVKAIAKAEEELKQGGILYCLGDIVHNGKEVERLEKMGLITINHEQFERLHNVKVMLRAHGEPPSTYEIAKRNNITLIDASCPVVLKLQSKIKNAYETAAKDDTQIVIYGQYGHAEVNGLVGQTRGEAIVIEKESDLSKLDLSKNIRLFSQTTKSLEGFNRLIQNITEQKKDTASFEYSDTICRQVSNRIPNITTFAQQNDIVIFVSGKKSSNGKILFQHCKNMNPNSYIVSEPHEVKALNLDLTKKIGICGATSTPMWLMEQVAETLHKLKK